MANQIIRITESDLHNIIKESVVKILNEENWQDAFDRFLDAPDITDSAEGTKLQKAKDDAIKAEFGKDFGARARAMKKYFRDREAKKMGKMTAAQKAEYLKYDDPNDNDDSDFDYFAAEKSKGFAPKADVVEPVDKKKSIMKNNPYAGKTPEELEALLQNHWGK